MVDIKQDSPEAPLNAPIPGQSLTAPLGDRPYQKEQMNCWIYWRMGWL